jgi:hypothetical protein
MTNSSSHGFLIAAGITLMKTTIAARPPGMALGALLDTLPLKMAEALESDSFGGR